MKKKIIYGFTALLILGSLFSAYFWKQQKISLSRTNSAEVMSVFTEKVMALYDNKKTDYLAENLTLADIAKVTDEFERILSGKKLSTEDLKNDAKLYQQWQEPQELLSLATKKLDIQTIVNSFFLSSDYRDLKEQEKVSKAYEDIKKATELMDSSDETSESTPLQSTTNSSEKKSPNQVKNFSQLVALNGDKENAFLIIQDELTKEQLVPLIAEFSKKTEKDSWDTSILTLIDNANKQLETLSQAETLVSELFTEGDDVLSGIPTNQYTEALDSISKIYNQTHQQRLMDRMILVAHSIGEELESKTYSYDTLTNKTDIIFTATQGNDKWWEGPLTFSVDIKNNSNKKISFNSSQFVIETEEMELYYSQYTLLSDVTTFIVEPGESYKLKDLTFTIKDEETAKKITDSYLSYLIELSKEDTTINTQTIKGLVVIPKPKEDTTPTTSSSDEKTEVVSSTVTEKQLNTSRDFLEKYGIDRAMITDGDLELLIIQSLSQQLNDEGFLQLVCKSLNIDYDTLIELYPPAT